MLILLEKIKSDGNSFVYIYVTVWLAIVFGINSVSNAGTKVVVVHGTAKH